MDPVANIVRQRQIAAEIQVIQDATPVPDGHFPAHAKLAELAIELAELVLALDEWRRRGGFDPYTAIPPL